MSLNIHQPIKEKLKYFHEIHKIPNLLFHGPTGSGKRTLINEYIHKIYDNDREKIKSFVMYVNCSSGKNWNSSPKHISTQTEAIISKASYYSMPINWQWTHNLPWEDVSNFSAIIPVFSLLPPISIVWWDRFYPDLAKFMSPNQS